METVFLWAKSLFCLSAHNHGIGINIFCLFEIQHVRNNDDNDTVPRLRMALSGRIWGYDILKLFFFNVEFLISLLFSVSHV